MRQKRVVLLCCALLSFVTVSVVTVRSAAQPEPPVKPTAYSYAGPTSNFRAELQRGIEKALWVKTVAENQWYAEIARQQALRRSASRTSRLTASSAPGVTVESVPSGGIEALIYSIFGANGAKAVHIAQCESGLDPSARNRSGASGLFQIMLPMHNDLFEGHGWDPSSDWSDPYKNATIAFEMSGGGANWSGWVCR